MIARIIIIEILREVHTKHCVSMCLSYTRQSFGFQHCRSNRCMQNCCAKIELTIDCVDDDDDDRALFSDPSRLVFHPLLLDVNSINCSRMRTIDSKTIYAWHIQTGRSSALFSFFFALIFWFKKKNLNLFVFVWDFFSVVFFFLLLFFAPLIACSIHGTHFNTYDIEIETNT